jgi:hypothetical protein
MDAAAPAKAKDAYQKYVSQHPDAPEKALAEARIAALSQYVPTVGVAYSDKFKGVFESVGAGHTVIDARVVDSGSAIEKVRSLYRNRQGEKAALTATIGSAQGIVTRTWDALVGRHGEAGGARTWR